MKTLTRFTLAAVAALACAHVAAAQATDGWVEFAPAGEGFAVLMPKQPASKPSQARAGELQVSGRRHVAAGEDGGTYVVWSLNDPSDLSARLSGQEYVSERFRDGTALYLDQAAELAWELLVTPEVERLKRENASAQRLARPGMVYRREFELDGRPAREYSVGLDKSRGIVYVCTDGPHIYVVAALGPDAQAARLKQFVESFSFAPVPKHPHLPAVTAQVDPMLIKPDPRDIPYGLPNSTATVPSSGTGGGMGTGSGGGMGSGDASAGYDRPFTPKEVAQRAGVTYKAEPRFTESARKFGVTGVVRIRAILDKTGEVTNIVVIKGLPHGLTQLAVEAARQIRFTPARKDGHAVSQYIVLEYNFNIY
jgi:TonB family protein